ncbi:TraR/DksA C4-type zinc finger protein [Methylomonas rosea]|uniref:TraR/DksA C4-type zinc finger protein n=1 Tax=Methylomonas rosea TaxID=2952227 RepID=UPI0035324C40
MSYSPISAGLPVLVRELWTLSHCPNSGVLKNAGVPTEGNKYSVYPQQRFLRERGGNMKPKATQLSFCSRCGDEIPPDELQFLPNTSLCAFCYNTQQECRAIHNSSIKISKPVLTLVPQNPKVHDSNAA